jgi:cell division septum initiation protein DivIVA
MARDVEELLTTLYELLSESFTLPLGNDRAFVDKDKALALLDEINAALPGFLKDAKRIAEEEEKIIAKARRDAEATKRAAEETARRMVSEQTVLTTAKKKADDILSNAESKSKEVRRAANEYVDNILKRTEEAIGAAVAEVRQSRAEFRIAAKK